MKVKTHRRKKVERNNDLVSKIIHKNRKCPSCGVVKPQVVHFLHKDILRDKRLLELMLCEDCIEKSRKEILETKNKRMYPLVPVLNSMLQVFGKFEEKSTEQLEKEFELTPQG